MYGVRKCSSSILLQVADQFPQHHLLKTLSFLYYIIIASFVKDKMSICAWISRWSSYFASLICGTLCQYHAVLMTVALQYSLKPGRLIPPVPFFFLKIALAIQGFLYFHTNCEIICSSYLENTIGSLIGIALNL